MTDHMTKRFFREVLFLYWFMMVDFGKPLSLKLNHNCFKDLVRLFKSIVGNDFKSSFQDKVSLQVKANAS